MTIREQLTETQWKQLFNGPFAAATYASLASGGAFELVKEMFAASKFMAETFQEGSIAGYGPLVGELMQEMKDLSRDRARELSPQFESKDPEALRSEVKAAVLDANQVASSLQGAEGYRRWLLDAALAAVRASRGGFLGIGASKEPVDEQEQQALSELTALLAA